MLQIENKLEVGRVYRILMEEKVLNMYSILYHRQVSKVTTLANTLDELVSEFKRLGIKCSNDC